jgi:hypothetical protein
MNLDFATIDFSEDPHTARFFAPEYHRGPVEKFFRIGQDDKAPPTLIYAGRSAQLLTGERVIVAHLFSYSPAVPVAQKSAVLVLDSESYHPLGWERLERDDFSWLFWARELFGGGGATPAQRRVFSLPSLSCRYFERYHVCRDETFVVKVSLSGNCSLLDMNAHPQGDAKLWRPSFDVDRGWSQMPVATEMSADALPSESSFQTGGGLLATYNLVGVLGPQFHHRLDQIASDGGSLLHERLRFARLSEEQRAYEVLGGDMVTLQRVMELFRLALQAEMYEGSALAIHEKLEFRPFLPYQQLCMAPNQTKRIAMPTTLRRRRSQIFKALKCHVAPGRYTPEGRTEHLNEWATRWVCRCSLVESMHEVFVAESRFNELFQTYRVR